MNGAVRGRDNQAMIVASAALVVAVAALVAAVVGPALAAPKDVVVRRVVVHQDKIEKGDIAPGAVTMKALAQGAVTAKKIRKGAVTGAKLAKASVTGTKIAKGSVTSESIAPGAVTGSSIASGSVSADKLGVESVVSKPIADLDKVAHNSEWTASNLEYAQCGPGELLLGGGFAFGLPTNGEASWLQALPVVNGDNRAIGGRFMSDAGGAAGGQVTAICLR